jgi:hypothetical protein
MKKKNTDIVGASDVIVANHHTGPIVLPRIYEVNVTGDVTKNIVLCIERTIPAGETTEARIPRAEWDLRLKRGDALKALMDRGFLSIVRKIGEVDFRTQDVSDLVVPPHLRGDAQEADSKTPAGGRVAAALDRKRMTVGTVTL